MWCPNAMVLVLVALILLLAHDSALCNNVISLDDKSFDQQIGSYPLVLVKFFAPWCGHCQRLAPEFISAADQLAKSGIPVTLAEVDCTKTTLCGKYQISGYPTLKIYREGKFFRDYDGPRVAGEIVKYMISMSKPPSTEIKNMDELENVLSSTEPTVVAYYKSSSDDLRSKYFDLASELMEHVAFVHTHEDIFDSNSDYHVRLYIPKFIRSTLEPNYIVYSGKFATEDFREWIRNNGYGLVLYRSPSNQFFVPDSNLVVVYGSSSLEKDHSGVKYLRNRMLRVVKNHTDLSKDFKFAYSFAEDFNSELTDHGLEHSPLPVATLRSHDGKKYVLNEYSPDALVEFLLKYKAGQLTPYLKSEPVPSDQSSVVKKVVAANFDEIVNDPTKDVLIVFHAPWCGHCKQLMPKFEQAAEDLKDEPHVILAKMDATSNDVPKPYEVTGYPTLYFVTKSDKSNPKRYEGGRNMEDIIKYIAAHSSQELVKYDRMGNTKKSEL